jgi:hypothetical protein
LIHHPVNGSRSTTGPARTICCMRSCAIATCCSAVRGRRTTSSSKASGGMLIGRRAEWSESCHLTTARSTTLVRGRLSTQRIAGYDSVFVLKHGILLHSWARLGMGHVGFQPLRGRPCRTRAVIVHHYALIHTHIQHTYIHSPTTASSRIFYEVGHYSGEDWHINIRRSSFTFELGSGLAGMEWEIPGSRDSKDDIPYMYVYIHEHWHLAILIKKKKKKKNKIK